MLQTIAGGVATIEDTIESYGLPREGFSDDSKSKPEYPEFVEGDLKINIRFSHDGKDDGFLYGYMRDKIAAEYADKMDIWFETPGIELIQEPEGKTVIGVVVDRKGERRAVRALNGVVIATGGFECNPNMVETYLGINHYRWMGGSYNTGDGIRMAQDAGARLWHMRAYEGAPGMISHVWPAGDHVWCPHTYMPLAPGEQGELNTGATIIVGDWGRRVGDESYKCRHGHVDMGNGVWDNPHHPNHAFAIWDKTQMDLIEEAGKMLDEYRGQLVECASIEEAAEVIS